MVQENANREPSMLRDAAEIVTGVMGDCSVYQDGRNRTIEIIFALLV